MFSDKRAERTFTPSLPLPSLPLPRPVVERERERNACMFADPHREDVCALTAAANAAQSGVRLQ